jgi:pSer/pThr/pTyr-binding forkhead associated (FHA) protein
VDDYAIDLPHTWNFEVVFTDSLPGEAIKASSIPVALHIASNKQPTINKPTTAYIKVLSGEAEQQHYTISSSSGKICIGRDRQTQTADGFFRVNTIAFPSTSESVSNRSISRQHAHIEWNGEAGSFFLFADQGGLPPSNKVKVQTSNGSLVKLQTTNIGHPLQEGDQIVLGESALLEFSYVNAS